MTGTTRKQPMVVASFRDHSNAQLAHDRLMNHGYSNSEINVLMSDATRSRYYTGGREPNPEQAKTAAAEGLGVGGAIGTAVGATLGAIVAIGTTIAVPGLGILVAGPILMGLAGGGAGALTGGLLGGLIGLGIPESNAKAYEAVLRDGGVVLGVVPHNAEDSTRVKEDFKDLHGENVCDC